MITSLIECLVCHQLLETNAFYKRKNGYRKECKSCHNKQAHINYLKKCKEIRQYRKEYYQQNKEKELKRNRLYNKEHKDELNQKYQLKKQNNIQFRLAANLRSYLSISIKGNYKTGSAIRDLGCTIDELKIYLESKFQPGMTWDNWSLHGWHIDHIVPLSSFDLTDREQFLKAVHYTNLQPLWAIDNIKKSNRI